MSVSNPLIKELKGWTRKLTECTSEINDSNPDLWLFCKSLETCFQTGILMHFDTTGFPMLPEAWSWLSKIHCKHLSSSDTYSLTVEQVKENLKVRTAVGRLRLLIRTCLIRKCLHIPVEILVRTPLLANDFYDAKSILGNDILGEIFLSVLFQASKLNFKLDLRNASFLDDNWQLPECTALELVPCRSLGISVCFVKGRALIVKVDKSSVAAEDDKVTIGDILDEINAHVVTSSTRGKLRDIMRKSSRLPISLYIVKHICKDTNGIYGPIAHLIRWSGIENMQRLLKSSSAGVPNFNSDNNPQEPRNQKYLNAGFSITYCGLIYVGTKGDVKQIERAILSLLKSKDVKSIPVKFECLEIGIRVTSDMDDTVICNQSYMEISSCGRTINIPDYFAFIAGDSVCNTATRFEAYVFHHKNEEEVQTILQSLGQGFQRTHYAV